MLRDSMKKILIWVMMLASLAGVCLLPSITVYALTYTEAANYIHKASQIQRIFNVAFRCTTISYGKGYASSYDMTHPSGLFHEQTGIGDIETDHTTMAAGPWLEYQIQGEEGGDGGVWCVNAQAQNIFEVLVNQTGIDYISQIACNYNDPNKPGMLAIHANGEELTDHCQDLIGVEGYDLDWRDSDDAEAYLKEFYNHYRQANNSTFGKYLPAAEDVGDFVDSKVAYYVYLDDFFTYCANKDATFTSINGAPMPTDTYWDSVPIIDPNTGGLTNVNYQKDIFESSWDYSVVGKSGARSCTDIITKLNDYAAAVSEEVEKEGDEAGTPENPDDPITTPGATDPGVETEPAPCYTAAGSLGWVLCPVLDFAGNATTWLYEFIISDFLVVDTDFFEPNNGTMQGWQYFQGFANIIFAILLLVIIISQVTGVGINNYGVKKVLPRLIVVAVLVNLSYIICQIAVDASNILGYELNELLSGIDIAGTDTWNSGEVIGSILNTLWTAGGVTAAGVAIVFTWEYWLLPFLLVLLTTLISVLFFFVILGVRKAGVILLVVIAPVAIVCYALPNTKKFFDRWLKMFSGLLLVYPICGALIGGGAFASRLLLRVGGQDAGFLYCLIAMLINIVPVFFIPSLVRSSMAAMGNLGAKIAGLGGRLSGSTTGAIRRSEGFQDSQRRLGMHNARRSINRINEGKDMRSRLSRRLGAIGMTKASQSMQGAADRSRKRAELRHRKAALEDIDYGADPLFPGSVTYEAMVAQAESKRVSEMAGAFVSNYEKSGDADHLDTMGAAHNAALQAVMRNPADVEAKARLMATHQILGASDPGREIMQNNFYRGASTLTADQQAGFTAAASILRGSHGGAIKKVNRGFESFLSDAAQGKTDSANFRADASATDKSGQSVVHSDKYDSDKIAGYTAATLAEADDTSLDRLERLAIGQDGVSGLTPEQQASLMTLTTEALTNSNLSIKDTARAKLTRIQNALSQSMGATPASASPDSIRIDHGGTPAPGAPTSTTPPPSNPAPGQGTPPTTPTPLSRSDISNSSFIVTGDMSMDAIKRVAEETKPRDGQSGNGPTIILPH